MPSRVAQLIRHFVGRSPGCGRTRIVKFLYMADHEARRYLGRPLTDLDYRWDNHGPFDPEILRQIQILHEKGFLEEERNQGNGYTWYRYRPTGDEFPCPLKKEEKAIVDHIVAQYADMKPDELLEDVVYQTRPMTAAVSRGERLRMELVDNEARLPGLELEHVLESDAELRAGGGRAFEDLLAEADDESWSHPVNSRLGAIQGPVERPQVLDRK